GPRFVFTPTVVIDTTLLTDFLFVQPHYYHYCFGDFYAPNFLQLGIYPSFAWVRSHSGYDPIFVHTLWSHRREPRWETQVREQYRVRGDHAALRRPRTFAAAQALAPRGGGKAVIEQGGTRVNVSNMGRLVQPLSRVASASGTRQAPLRLERITRQQQV